MAICSVVIGLIGSPSSSRASESWTKLNESGFGDPHNSSATVFPRQGILYALTNKLDYYQFDEAQGTWSTVTDWEATQDPYNINSQLVVDKDTHNKFFAIENKNTGAEVWMLTPEGDWAQINEDGFGDAENERVRQLSLYNGSATDGQAGLVAFVLNSDTQNVYILVHQIGDAASEWTQLGVIRKADFDYSNFTAEAVFNSEFYIATRNDSGYASDGIKKGRVWKSVDGESWELVYTVDHGRVSSLQLNEDGTRLWALGAQKSRNCGEKAPTLASTIDGTTWKEAEHRKLDKQCFSLMHFRLNGKSIVAGHTKNGNSYLYRKDGTDWDLITGDGFGHSQNEQFSSATVWQGKFVVATRNRENGTQIFVKFL